MDLLKKLRHLAVQNAFNEKQTADFIKLVESGTSIDDAIDMAEEGISEYKPVQEDVTTDKPTEQPDGVHAALDILDEMASKFNNAAFEKIRENIKLKIRKSPDKAAKAFNDGKPPRERIYNMIVNLSGDWLESGEYHMYRGVLNPMGIGEDLLKLFDTTIDELVLIGACDKKLAKEQKKGVRDNIKTVG